MDPNAAYDRITDAMRDRDYEEAWRATRDLLAWLDAGGCAPDRPRIDLRGHPRASFMLSLVDAVQALNRIL